MPEIFEDNKGRIVGVIVTLPFGMYGVSARTKLCGREDTSIVQKSFGRLDEARSWLQEVTAGTTTDGTMTRLSNPVKSSTPASKRRGATHR